MAETIRCDECGLVANRTPVLLGWLHLEHLGAQDYRVAPELDFCTWVCLRNYADKHTDDVVGVFDTATGRRLEP